MYALNTKVYMPIIEKTYVYIICTHSSHTHAKEDLTRSKGHPQMNACSCIIVIMKIWKQSVNVLGEQIDKTVAAVYQRILCTS